jgi:hypothetical protein
MSMSFLRNVTADGHSPAARLLARIPRKALLVSLVLTLALSNVHAPNFAPAMGLSLAALFLAGFGLLLTVLAAWVLSQTWQEKEGQGAPWRAGILRKRQGSRLRLVNSLDPAFDSSLSLS